MVLFFITSFHLTFGQLNILFCVVSSVHLNVFEAVVIQLNGIIVKPSDLDKVKGVFSRVSFKKIYIEFTK